MAPANNWFSVSQQSDNITVFERDLPRETNSAGEDIELWLARHPLVKTTEPNRSHVRSGEDSALEKEAPSKAPGLEVKVFQPGQKEPTKQTAKEFALIGKKLKSKRVKP